MKANDCCSPNVSLDSPEARVERYSVGRHSVEPRHVWMTGISRLNDGGCGAVRAHCGDMITPTKPTPVGQNERITNLDAIRGIAVLGILVMNAVSFGLPTAGYFNLSAAGSENRLDWVIGIAGEVFVDQKTMGLFSMLFGAGIVLFADRADEKSAHPIRLALWRNALLLLIGFFHGLLWEGDVLIVYALCSPLLMWLRRLAPRQLLAIGTALVLWSAVGAILAQPTVPASGLGLGDYWLLDGSAMSDAVGLFLLNDFFARSLGMMLIGVGLYRLGLFKEDGTSIVHRRFVVLGLGVGIPLAVGGVVLQWAFDFEPSIAIIGEIPNTLATIPMSLAYLTLIIRWNQRPDTALHRRVRAAGRMALTNYLTQTLIGFAVLRWAFGDSDLTRSSIAVFVIAVWIIQLAWSAPWLDRFRYGPAEWLWRSATYWKPQPLRRQ